MLKIKKEIPYTDIPFSFYDRYLLYSFQNIDVSVAVA
jgi:hypothetical protein